MRFGMTSRDSLCLKKFTAGVLASGLLAAVPLNKAQAKTDIYNRNSSTGTSTSTDNTDDSDNGSGTSSSGNGSSSKSKKQSSSANSANPGASPSPDKKVDLSDLENRYWTAKDTEFNVVQNRLYTKAHKFSVTLQGGTNLSDVYTNNFNYGLDVNYYFSERSGVEMSFWMTSATDASFVQSFGQEFNLIPDHNMPQGYVGFNYNWIPIYAKLSLLEKKILYFDMSLSPGIGMTFLKADTFASPPTFVAPSATSQGDLTIAVDLAQQVFLDEHWALRLDLKNHFYQATTYSASSGASEGSKFIYNAIVMFGVTYFFH